MANLLTRDDLLKKSVRKLVSEVVIDELGGSVKIRPMSALEQSQFVKNFDAEDALTVLAEVVLSCLVEPAFESADEVVELPMDALNAIFHEVSKLSGLDEKVDLDEAEKNSETMG